MSSFIPFEIQIEILKRVPAISLIRFRSVCKSWKSLINSSDFINSYRYHLHHPHIHITYEVGYVMTYDYGYEEETDAKYVNIVDDNNTFPRQNFIQPDPPLLPLLDEPTIIGSSHGLLCLFGYYKKNEGTGTAVIWNPAIRKSIAVSTRFPNFINCVIGFGVCPKTNDPKIVKITNSMWRVWPLPLDLSSPMEVEVFSLRLREWRIPCSNVHPRNSIIFQWSQAVVGQCIYWIANEVIAKERNYDHRNLIMSFDLCTEEFKEVQLPQCLLDTDKTHLSICKPRESLVVLNWYSNDAIQNRVCDAWMMEDGDRKTFTKLFIIKPPRANEKWWVLGFRNTGELIMTIVGGDEDDYCSESRVVVYEPRSEQPKDLGIYGRPYSFSLNNLYEESLLLLDNDDDGYIA